MRDLSDSHSPRIHVGRAKSPPNPWSATRGSRPAGADRREAVYYAARVGEVPLTIAAITADVLQNLRKALDHLASELVLVAGSYPTRNSGFPIFSSVAIYKAQAP